MIYVSLKAAISPRPASWILERSFDGAEFFPWQYFGVNDDDCQKRYNLRGQNEPYEIETDDQIICSTQFSKAVPLENGEVCYIHVNCSVYCNFIMINFKHIAFNRF